MPGVSKTSHDDLAAEYRDVRALVTGGTGFIGVHLVEALLGRGADVTVLDDLSSSDTEFLAPLVDRHPDRVRFVYASVLDDEALEDAVEEREVCFHLAAVASVPESVRDPQRTYDVNTLGTVRVAEACRRAGVKRVVNASSSAVYQDDPSGAPRREDGPIHPTSPYGASKASAESILASHARTYPIDTVSLRFFNAYGPRQRAGGAYAAVIPKFVNLLNAGERCTIFGDGSATRDFVPVSELVRGVLLAGIRRAPFRGVAINIGSGKATSVRALHDTLAALFGTPDVEPVCEAEREGDIAHSVADMAMARKQLGFECDVTLEEGLRDLLRSMGVTPKDHAPRR